jgi:hypothetical protein
MPPRIREIKELATKLGWYKLRAGRGDHEIWTNSEHIISFDGADGLEIPNGTLKSYLKRLGVSLEKSGKGKRRKKGNP